MGSKESLCSICVLDVRHDSLCFDWVSDVLDIFDVLNVLDVSYGSICVVPDFGSSSCSLVLD